MGGRPMRFIGLDLAWSPRNNSAAVALESENGTASWITSSESLGDDQEVLDFVGTAAGDGPAMVAVDAPLIVPNSEGARPVDREITRLLGHYGAGCHPAYRNRPGGCQRGEKIVAALAQQGFVQQPHFCQREAVRSIFEVYPHPAMVALFHLEHTLKYKARPDRSPDLRCSELARLRDLVRSLEHCQPAVHIPSEVADRQPHVLQGRAFKRYEDLLDAALCAYIAYYAWYWGPAGYHVFGDLASGYILVPMTAWLRQRLAQPFGGSQRSQPSFAS